MIKYHYNLKYHQVIELLKSAREEKGLSLRGLAKKLGVDHKLIRKTELLERRLDVSEYVKYCSALDLDPHDGIKILQDESE